jgi:hypothetical protein
MTTRLQILTALAAGTALMVGTGAANAVPLGTFQVTECSLAGNSNVNPGGSQADFSLCPSGAPFFSPQPVTAQAIDSTYQSIITLGAGGTFTETGSIIASKFWQEPGNNDQNDMLSTTGYSLMTNVNSASGTYTLNAGVYTMTFTSLNLSMYAVNGSVLPSSLLTSSDTYNVNTGAGGNGVLLATSSGLNNSFDSSALTDPTAANGGAQGDWIQYSFPFTLTAAGSNYFTFPTPNFYSTFEINGDLLSSINGNVITSDGSGTAGFLAQVPEPASLTLLGSALLGLGAMARRRRSKKA